MKLRDYERMPQVGAGMAPFPHVVQASDSLLEVERQIREYGVRYIPVQENGAIVGLISQRDLGRPAPSAAERGRIRADELMRRDPYVVDFATPLDEVLETMLDRRIEVAVVMKRGKAAGIFSGTEAFRILAGELAVRFPEGPDAA